MHKALLAFSSALLFLPPSRLHFPDDLFLTKISKPHGFDEITITYMHHHLTTIQARLSLLFFACFSSCARCWMGRLLIRVLFGVFLQHCISLKPLFTPVSPL
jgi:hypothetical protein